ncbi:MAG: M14 family metallocarboxypeptidase [Clostridia bacterium]|nr:M14 family metallocarboxypeptidase [Clostridia bacterium]
MYIIDSEKAYTYENMHKDVEQLCKEYSFLELFSLGQSVCGRELLAIRWGCGDKRIFLNGAHHGMEWITSLLLMRMLEEFSHQYAEGTAIGNVRFKELFEEISLVICPMVNPDGVGLSIEGLPESLPPIMKTRLKSYNNDQTDFTKWQANINGVDLNHNYDAAFEKGVFYQHKLGIFGPGPTRYSGPCPESEPESKAVADFTRDFRPHIVVAYHTQGEIIYFDFESQSTERGRHMAKTMAEIAGYELDQTEGMASYSGYKDWVINEFHIPAFTVEVGLGENPLPLSQFGKIYRDNLSMLLYLVKA